MKNYHHFWRRTVSTLLDSSAIYCIALFSQVLIYKFTFIAFGNIFIGVFIAYFFLSYTIFKGRTPAKILIGLKITGKNETKTTLIKFAIREIILKGIAGIIIPLYIFENVPLRTTSIMISFELILIVFISAIFLLVFKRTWWEWLSGTITIMDKDVSKAQLACVCGAFAALHISFISVSILPVLINKYNLLTKLPVPNQCNREVKQYADYIRNYSKDPVDYIFDLFKKFDIVVISERKHPEYTQYEFIFKLIRDKRFSERVGNLFTECGSVSYQDSLDTYLHTLYPTEADLNRATARLAGYSDGVWPLWSNTNFFELFKIVHSVNHTLAESNRINWYFTDLPVNWENATHETYLHNYTTPYRDSLMAVQVIEKYNRVLSLQKNSKALVIMNTYHGYGLASNGKNYFHSTTGYIMKALPGKVSNVMMNTISKKLVYVDVPVANGKWDAAFEMAGNPEAGFNFVGSPFGDDHFDARSLQIRGMTYKNVFTGYIFYTPLIVQYSKIGFPFEFENMEDRLLKRGACIDQQYVGLLRQQIKYFKLHPKNPYIIEPAKLLLIYNLIHYVAFPFLIFICLTINVIIYSVRLKQINKLCPTGLQPSNAGHRGKAAGLGY